MPQNAPLQHVPIPSVRSCAARLGSTVFRSDGGCWTRHSSRGQHISSCALRRTIDFTCTGPGYPTYHLAGIPRDPLRIPAVSLDLPPFSAPLTYVRVFTSGRVAKPASRSETGKGHCERGRASGLYLATTLTRHRPSAPQRVLRLFAGNGRFLGAILCPVARRHADRSACERDVPVTDIHHSHVRCPFVSEILGARLAAHPALDSSTACQGQRHLTSNPSFNSPRLKSRPRPVTASRILMFLTAGVAIVFHRRRG